MTGISAIVESLNIGLPRREVFRDKEITTGICKTPVPGPLYLTREGFEGDGVADTKHHGGPDKAVCVYSAGHYPYWEDMLGIKLPVAAFGENLTVSNMWENHIFIGDIFQLGMALVQVSQPRQPCKTLAARYGRSDLIKLVVDSGRTGFYLRVLKEGMVEKGATLIHKGGDTHHVTVAFANYIYHHDRSNYEAIREILAVQTLSGSWKLSFQKLLENNKS